VRPGGERDAAASLAKRLRLQSFSCADLGSALYADLLARAAGDTLGGGPTWEVLRGHEGDRAGSALALRLMGGVHRLVLEGELPALAALYADPGRDPAETWRAFAAALAERRGELRRLVELPVQTNEVGRSAALLPGFLAVAARTGLPLRLLELGASAGLNLRWDRYRYAASGFRWGPAGAPLTIGFELRGPHPPTADVAIAERRGCDRAPLDPTSEEGRLTLLSYVWADQPRRAERILAAAEVARATPAVVERAGAAEWLEARLREASEGVATVVFHSIVMQYLPRPERAEVSALLEAAGRGAVPGAPLARLAMEPAGERAELRLTTWPGGEERLLGSVGYHGDPVLLGGAAPGDR